MDINEITWTKIKKLDQKDITNNLQELHNHLQNKNEHLTTPPESSFQPGSDTQNKQSVLLSTFHTVIRQF